MVSANLHTPTTYHDAVIVGFFYADFFNLQIFYNVQLIIWHHCLALAKLMLPLQAPYHFQISLHSFENWLFVRHWLTNSHAQSIQSETGKIPLLQRYHHSLPVGRAARSHTGILIENRKFHCYRVGVYPNLINPDVDHLFNCQKKNTWLTVTSFIRKGSTSLTRTLV